MTTFGTGFGQTSSLFGQQPQNLMGNVSSFGQPTATNTFGQPQQQTGGLFGSAPAQNTSGFGGASSFGQPQTQTQWGMPSQSTFGGATQGLSSFGNNASSGFKSASTGFGAQQSSGLWGPPAQSSSSFGQQPQQTISSFGQPTTSGGFGQQSSFMPQNQSAFQGLSSGIKAPFGNVGNTPQEVQIASKGLYSEQVYYPPQIKSQGKNFQPKSKMIDSNSMTFYNLRSEPEFDRVSAQMIRLLDLMQNAPNYEYTAFQEYQSQKYQNPPRYSQHLQQQLSLIEQGASSQTGQAQGSRQVTQNQGGLGAGGFGQNNSSQWGGQQASNFGQVSAGVQSLWGGQQQQQQPQQQPGGFMQGQGQPVGGGLFGQTPQQPTGGLGGFQVSGSMPRQDTGLGFNTLGQQQNTGGLFGKPGSQQQTSGVTGLFGQQQQPQQIGGGATGLFGQQQQQPQQQLGGGSSLFGQQNATPQAQSGFLGNTSAQPLGGLFGNKSPQQSSTGLFGQPSASGGLGLGQQSQAPGLFATPQINVSLGLGGGGGIFGQQQAQQQPGGGLFGGQQKPGGLFGQSQQTQQEGGLFKTTQQPATGLFGQVGAQPIGGLFQSQGQGVLGQNQQTQQQVDPNQILYDLYSTKDPLGLANSFIAKDHPMDITNKEIDELKKSIESKFKSTEKASLDKVVDQMSNPNFDDQVYLLQDQINLQRSASSVYYEEEVERRRAKEAIKLENLQKYQLQARQNLMNPQIPNKLYRKELFAPVQSQIIPKPDLSRSKEDSLAAPASNTLVMERHTLKITLNFSVQGQQFENSFEIHKTRETKDVIREVMRWLLTEFKFDGDASEVIIEHSGSPLATNLSLEKANITSDTTLVVRIPGIDSKQNLGSQDKEAQKQSGKIQESQLVLQDRTAPKEIQPTKPKPGYKCSPAFEKFEQMTTRELENVENFTISNQFGSIKFIGKTDLTRVDLQDIVTIQQNVCEVYDDNKWQNNKPAVGQKLNKPAIITLHNIKPKVNQLPVQKERSLKENLESKGDAEHISYDHKDYTWTFKVQHFTKWGDDDDEMENENNDQNAAKEQVEVSGGIQFERSAFDEQSEIEGFNLINTSQKVLKKDENVRFSLFSQKDNAKQLVQQNQAAPSLFMTQSVNLNQQIPVRNSPIVQDVADLVSNFIPKRNEQNQSVNAHNLLKKIKQRSEVFSKINPLDTKILSYDETQQKLKEMLQVQKLSITKTSLARRGIPRPCFHPSGNGILITQGNKISLKSLPVTKSFGLLTILKQTVTFQDNDCEVENQMQNLHISSQADVLMENLENTLTKTEFTDEFFRKLLEKPLPESKMFTKPGDIYNFLLKTAKYYVEKADLRTQKLNEEFFVICMLNALFGNPNVHLCQLHPKFTGPKNIERTQLLENEELNDSYIITVKKRRNAVAEVLRLMCDLNFSAQIPPQQFQQHPDQIVYKTALQLLENGDLRAAVKFLNKNGKTKLSLLVAQSKSNTAAMHLVREMTQQQGFGNKFDANLKSVLNLVTGQNQKSQDWEKNLLSALLYKKCHSENLKTMVQQLQQENKDVESLVWKILLVYARCKDSEQQLCAMNGKLLRQHDPADFKIRWLCCLVMRTALLDHQKQASDNEWSPFIPDYVLTHFSSKYISQLLRSNQSVEACYVASLIPQSKLRKRALFEIILKWKEGLDQKHVLLEEYVKCSSALNLQNFSQTSKAVDTWLNIGNAVQAEYLLSKDYLPLQIRYDSDFSTLKDYYIYQQVFGQSNVFAPVHSFKNYEIQMNKAQSKLGESWSQSMCGVYVRTKNLDKSVRKESPAYTNILAELEKIYQDMQMLDQSSNIIHWVRTQLTDIATVLRQRQPNLSQDVVLIQGVPIDQAKRCLSGVLLESYVKVK